MRARHITSLILLPILLAGAGSCRPATPAAAPVPAGPRPDQGIVAFMSGVSWKSEGGDWAELDIGSLLESGDAVKTAEGAFCEIQFGRVAVVRLEDSSVVMIDEILAELGSAEINVRLVAGTVLCKVQQLSREERFRVRTRSAICGVRGTEFGVDAQTDGSTRLYVKSGAVTFTPLAADPDRLAAAIPEGKQEEFSEVVAEIAKIEPVVVSADQEARLTAETQNAVEVAVQAIEERIDRATEQIAAESTGQAAALSVEVESEITRAVMEVTRLTRGAGKTAPVSTASQRSLAPLQRMRILEQLEVPPIEEAPQARTAAPEVVAERTGAAASDAEGEMLQPPADTPSAEKPAEQPAARTAEQPPAEKRPELAKVAIQVEPSDAEIYLASGYIGTGSFAGYFEIQVPLAFAFERDGYAPQTLQVVPSKDSKNFHPVKLEPLKVTTAALEQVTVTTVPADAEILLDGRSAGTGTFTAAYAPGTILSFEVRKDGYLPGTLKLTVAQGMRKNHTVSLARNKEPVEIAVTPKDAEIVKAGTVIGRGSWSGEFPAGTSVTVTLKRLGYASRDLTMVVKEGGPNTVSVELEPRPVLWRVAAITAEKAIPAWRIAAGDDAFYFADSRGTVRAVSRDGTALWTVETTNTSNENSVPVIAGQRIVFTGGAEMVTIDRRTGRVLTRKDLDGDTSHIFGRRVLPLSDGIVFPEENALVAMDAGTAVASRRVAITAGSQMSPAAWGGRVLIADNEGTLLIFGASDWQLEAEVATEAVQPVAIAATVAADRAFFADRKGFVVCVDLAAGAVAWQRKLDAAKSIGVFQDLAVDAGVVCAYSKNTLYVLSAGTGAPLYAPIAGVSAPALLAGGELVYGTTDGSLKIAAAATGKVLKSLALGARVAAQPLAAGDRLVLALANGEFLMVYPASIR